MGLAIDFIMICETFLNDANMNMFPIPGYNCVCNNRILGKGGGSHFERITITFDQISCNLRSTCNFFYKMAADHFI